MDYSNITTRIGTGAALGSAADVEDLVNAGYTHVIDCVTDSFENTSAFALHPALSCLWNPTEDDGQTKDASWFRPSVEFGMMCLGNPNTKLYCHCQAGVNRGPSTAFSVMLAAGWDYNTAIELIHTARPVTMNGIRYASDAANALHQMGYI